MSDLGLLGGARGAGAGLVAAPRGRFRSRGREGSVPFSRAGRPAGAGEGLSVPPSGGDGRRARPAGAGLPGLPARPGTAEASLSSPGRWGNRYRHCWGIPWESLLILWCVRGGKGVFPVLPRFCCSRLVPGDTIPQPEDESSGSTVLVVYASSLRQSVTIALADVAVGWGTSG